MRQKSASKVSTPPTVWRDRPSIERSDRPEHYASRARTPVRRAITMGSGVCLSHVLAWLGRPIPPGARAVIHARLSVHPHAHASSRRRGRNSRPAGICRCCWSSAACFAALRAVAFGDRGRLELVLALRSSSVPATPPAVVDPSPGVHPNSVLIGLRARLRNRGRPTCHNDRYDKGNHTRGGSHRRILRSQRGASTSESGRSAVP